MLVKALREMLYKWRHIKDVKGRKDLFLLHAAGMADTLRVKEEADAALQLPLKIKEELPELRAAAVLHIFYPELSAELYKYLQNVPQKMDVYISTTDEKKKQEIEHVFSHWDKGKYLVRVFPNRGRDIAPMLVGFSDVYKNYDVCLHLHSKKSLHAADELYGWREYMLKNLLGSPELVHSIFYIFMRAKVGMICPQYFAPLRKHINWGKNYEITRELLEKIDVFIDNKENILEFPAGSMFWFRPETIRPLLEQNLSFEDFPEEDGQTDGTLAHAIERSFFYAAEKQGLAWMKVIDKSFILASRNAKECLAEWAEKHVKLL